MNPFEFVIAIIVLSFAYKLVDVWLRHRHLQRTDESEHSELKQRLAELEERVRVLERIVTDERFDLKRQFKDLEG
jgi:membrane protein implicated in regulation of membrane protease activity